MQTLKIVSWNVNGLRAVIRKDKLYPIIEELMPDILCLQETKAQKGQAEIDLKEYEEYWNSAENKKGYSGVAVFTKIKPEKATYNLPKHLEEKYKLDSDPYGNPNKEGRVLTLEFEKFFVVNVYTPNSKPNLERLELRHKKWDPAFLEYIKELDKQKPVVVCGDFNVAHTEDDLARPEENEGSTGFTKQEREAIDNIISSGFVDTFREFKKGKGYYSWWNFFGRARERNIGWRIDYIFVSKRIKEALLDADIHPDFYGSDHAPVSVLLDILKIK